MQERSVVLSKTFLVDLDDRSIGVASKPEALCSVSIDGLKIIISMFFIQLVFREITPCERIHSSRVKIFGALVHDKFHLFLIVYTQKDFLTTEKRELHGLLDDTLLPFAIGYVPGHLIFNFFVVCNFSFSHLFNCEGNIYSIRLCDNYLKNSLI